MDDSEDSAGRKERNIIWQFFGLASQKHKGEQSTLGRRGTGRSFEYNRNLGRWWYTRAIDRSHSRAYRTVADYIRDSFRKSPALIVDYACGAGNLLSRLSTRFPHSRLVGLDGSAFLLHQARRRLTRLSRERRDRITLIESALPDYDLCVGAADLLVFSFPNMVPFSGAGDPQVCKSVLGADDLAAAERLAEAGDPGRDPEDPDAVQCSLLQGRLISLDLRRLLRRGGFCVRVEYGKARRHELSHVDLMRVSFEEGSLEEVAGGGPCNAWFRVVASSYFRSRVVEDVYQQTGDERDRAGGYLITVLRAL